MKKVGIITFHNSYNCGSMLETYAIQKYLEKCSVKTEIIDFSSNGQKEMYAVFSKNNSLKNILKNVIIFPHYKKIEFNNNKYEEFKQRYFRLSKEQYSDNDKIDDKYDIVIAGSDQIWNTTIPDSSDNYFLCWQTKGKKIAYAPSFGAKEIKKDNANYQRYCDFLNDFDVLSTREKNGKKWIKNMTNKDIPVLIDPTLLLNSNDYDIIVDESCNINEKYIFFYCPEFNADICRFVKRLSKKYNLKVIAWSTKNYYKKFINRFGFELPKYESPSVYLSLIKNAELVMTTSFHGTIFSTIFKKDFYTIKNGGMYGSDDRVLTLLEQLHLMERLIPFDYDENKDYLNNVNYEEYDKELPKLQQKAKNFIKESIITEYEKY